MTAVRKIHFEEEIFAAEVAPEKAGNALKNIALFLASPFIGLAYIVAFPLVGLAAVAVLAARVAGKYEAVRMAARFVKRVTLVVAAPFVGLAYVLAFPFVGLAALAWMGGRAVVGAR